MVKSMTGYGRAQKKIGALDVLVELRSVNHRYLDCNVRTPRMYNFLEDPIKKIITASLSRGKCDVYVTIDRSKAEEGQLSLNRGVLESTLSILDILIKEYGLPDDRTACVLARFPDVIGIEKETEDTESLIRDVSAIAQEAVNEFNFMRACEGERLQADILARMDTIEALVTQIEMISPKRVEEYRNRLRTHMEDVLYSAGIDEQRILQEAALYADRIAVDEETVRLRSHLKQLREMLKSEGAIGRKIDFLIQELNREANTIGSKSNDLDMTKMVVEMKSEIEKIREQAQNIE